MRVRVLTSHILPGQRIAEVGDVLVLEDRVARVKVAAGFVEAIEEVETAPAPAATEGAGEDAEASSPDGAAQETDGEAGKDETEKPDDTQKGDGGDATQPASNAPAQKPRDKRGGKDK